MGGDDHPVGMCIEVGRCFARVLKTWKVPTDRALYVGLSGGIGSGKSTVAEVWEAMGAKVISADQLARDVVAPGSEGLAEIVARFGVGVLTTEGALDRKEMGRQAFASERNRADLEAITHPRIAQMAAQLRAQAGNDEVVVYDVPLLVEADMAEHFDCVMMVHAPKHLRIARLEERGVQADMARQRMSVQATKDQRLQMANVWVHNGGSRFEMSEVASRVFTAWLKEKK